MTGPTTTTGACVERRKNGYYLYVRRRVRGRLVTAYAGALTADEAAGFRARIAAGKEAKATARAKVEAAARKACEVLAAGAEFELVADNIYKAVMHFAGYHLHRRWRWRLRRGAKSMDVLDELTDLAELAAPAGGGPSTPATTAPLLPLMPAKPRRAIVRPLSTDPAAQAVLDRAARGDLTALPAVRELLRDSRYQAAFGDVADMARDALVRAAAGDDLAVAEAVKVKLGEVVAGLLADAGPYPTFAERVAAGRAGHGWLRTHLLEALLGAKPAGSPEAAAIEKALNLAEKRLQAALKALAVLRRLRGPVVAQVNVSAGPMVVNNGTVGG